MKTKLLSGLFIFGLFAAFALPADAQGAPPPLSNNPGEITIARVRGEVFATVKATNLKTPLQNNAKISQGSIVTTGKDSSVVLVFSNGATINLGTNSALDIEQFTQDPFAGDLKAADITDEPTRSTTKLNLTHGELVGKVAHLKKDQGSSFTVGTPVGAAGIRGTIFRIVYIPDGNGKANFSMTTLEGNVAVTLVGAKGVSAPVGVSAGQAVSVAVDITVNPTTGVITITPVSAAAAAAASSAPAQASTADLAAVAASAQQIATAVSQVVITPPAITNTTTTSAPATVTPVTPATPPADKSNPPAPAFSPNNNAL